MDFSLTFEYSPFLILPAAILAALVAFALYYKSRYAEEQSFWSYPNAALLVLRGLGIFLLLLLLLNPLVKYAFKEVEKPIVAVVLDDSESIKLNKDSTFYEEEWPDLVQQIKDDFGSDYEVRFHTFGETFEHSSSLSFQQKRTDIAGALSDLYDTYYKRNLGAVVLASDGIYNKGRDPRMYAAKFKAPIYTIALGDTVPPKDLKIKNLRYNRLVYSGNRFMVEALLEADFCEGEEVKVSLWEEDQKVDEQNWRIGSDQAQKYFTLTTEAGDPGLKRYQVKLTKLEGEISHVNNEQAFFIDVIESKKKIMLVAAAPHPDIAALRHIISQNERYEVHYKSMEEWMAAVRKDEGAFEDYSLMLYHQLPTQNSTTLAAIEKLKDIPSFFVVGARTQLSALQKLEVGLKIQQKKRNTNDAQGVLADGFALFSLPDATSEVLKKMPPLKVPYGDYSWNTAHDMMLKQKIGNVTTDMPLLAFTDFGGNKSAVLAGEGIWRWRLNAKTPQEQDVLAQIINKSIQYLALQKDQRLFRLVDPKYVFHDGERIRMEVELYNASYEPVSGVDIRLEVADEDGKTFNYRFREMGAVYNADLGFMEKGNYIFTATTQHAGEQYELSGQFRVTELDLEYRETTANHQLLYALANESGGKMFFPQDFNTHLLATIKDKPEITSKASMVYDLQSILNQKIWFFVLIAIFAIEWFARKFYGGY